MKSDYAYHIVNRGNRPAAVRMTRLRVLLRKPPARLLEIVGVMLMQVAIFACVCLTVSIAFSPLLWRP